MPRSFIAALGALVTAAGLMLAAGERCNAETTAPATSAPTFIGVAACSSCHQAETVAWRGSHHDLAMQVVGARFRQIPPVPLVRPKAGPRTGSDPPELLQAVVVHPRVKPVGRL